MSNFFKIWRRKNDKILKNPKKIKKIQTKPKLNKKNTKNKKNKKNPKNSTNCFFFIALQSTPFQNPRGLPLRITDARRTDKGRKSLCLILDSLGKKSIPDDRHYYISWPLHLSLQCVILNRFFSYLITELLVFLFRSWHILKLSKYEYTRWR